MPTVLIAGGTGLVGKRLSKLLKEKSYDVLHLSRRENLNATFPAYRWDVEQGLIDEKAVQQADYVINLAGTGIADKRWSASRKKLIIDSRVKSNQLLKTTFLKLQKTPKAYLSAAAIGIYGNRGDEILTEDSPIGTKGFLVESCIEWEKAIEEMSVIDTRIAVYRIGIVLSTQGGALEKMLLSFKTRVGAYFGNGEQYFSWIHIDDLCSMLVAGIENEHYKGIYNAVAPNAVSNKQMTYDLKKALGIAALIVPAPAAALRLAMGEMADVVLHGNRLSAAKLQQAGYQFKFPELIPALKDLLSKKI